MWQQLHYRERGSESECDGERASASITMAKCLRLPVAVFTLPYVAVSQAVFVVVYVSVSAAVSALESPGQLMYMCCLHAAILQLLFAFVCSSEAFKKFTIQFFLLLIRSHTHTQTHTRSPSLTHPFLAVCLGTWHAFRIAFCIEFINI